MTGERSPGTERRQGGGETAPYTRPRMDAARAVTGTGDDHFDGLHAEAKAAVSRAANDLRAVRDRYRTAYLDELTRGTPRATTRTGPTGRPADLGLHQQELSKLDLAGQTLEQTWLFLERGDRSLLADAADPELPADARMRIVEAREAERNRIAQEVHDGPAQALSNAIFQVEYIDRVLDQDLRLARAELRYLRDLLRRELGGVRSFISQLRPPVLDSLGLDGALADTVENLTALTGLPIELRLEAPIDALDPAQQTVVLRVVQEALQNVRKHAAPTTVRVATRLEADTWVAEVIDDGRGFDPEAVAAQRGRSFGLQFMRERSDLIGARLEVRSRPDGGTVVRLAIPPGGEKDR